MRADKTMIVTDLDGTLLTDEHHCSRMDLETLHSLGENGHYRVIATGRSLFSLTRILGDNFPVDYIIFSSGAAMINCRTGKITVGPSLDRHQIADIRDSLETRRLDYVILHEIPQSHFFTPFAGPDPHPDFVRRQVYYREFMRDTIPERACQFLAVTDPCEKMLASLSTDLHAFKVIRATSPIDRESMWLEVYPENVSKAQAAEALRQQLAVPPERTVAIGNDYNDIDLLQWAAQSAVVAGAPTVLRSTNLTVSGNNESGFSEATRIFLEKLGSE